LRREIFPQVVITGLAYVYYKVEPGRRAALAIWSNLGLASKSCQCVLNGYMAKLLIPLNRKGGRVV